MQNHTEEVRNLLKKLVCTYDQEKGILEIQLKGCSTKAMFPPGTPIHFEHSRITNVKSCNQPRK